MAEFDPFTPNTVIQLAAISELVIVENMVAGVIDPEMAAMQQRYWDGRVYVGDLVRPPDFNGRFTDIELISLEDPYAKLKTAGDDGWAWQYGSPLPVSEVEHNVEARAERCIGFHFIANARSSGRGIIGQIQAGLWYLPVVSDPDGKKAIGQNGGCSVRRIVTKPKCETKEFIEARQRSVRIGFAVL